MPEGHHDHATMSEASLDDLLCSGHGEAVISNSDSAGGNVTCTCDYYFKGADCSVPLSEAVGYGGWAAFMAVIAVISLYGFIATLLQFRKRFYCWNVCLCGDGYSQPQPTQSHGRCCQGLMTRWFHCCRPSQRRHHRRVVPVPFGGLKYRADHDTSPGLATPGDTAHSNTMPSSIMFPSTPAPPEEKKGPEQGVAAQQGDGVVTTEEATPFQIEAGPSESRNSVAGAVITTDLPITKQKGPEQRESKYAGEFGPRISDAAQRRPLRAWKDLNIRDLAAYLNFIGTGLRLIWCIGELQPSIPPFLY